MARELVLHVASLENDQNSELEVHFLLNEYGFHTVKSRKILNETIISQGSLCLEVRRDHTQKVRAGCSASPSPHQAKAWIKQESSTGANTCER
jgi:hypothetical protein